MSSDLSKFAKTISKLKYEYNAPDLGEKISLHEPGAKASDKFLIKMEIRRLAQPINRVLDLRSHIKEGCVKVERGGVNHYLDELAIEDLDRELSNYQNVYCMGVFEQVLSKAKNRDKKTVLESKLPDPGFDSLTRVNQRRDIRIYYSTEVELLFHNDVAALEQSEFVADLRCNTTDLSERGLSLKIADTTTQLPHTLFVKFTGLENEFAVPKKLYVRYNLLRQIAKQGIAYAILTLDEEQSEDTLKICSSLLKACIHNQKRRNRVPVDNTVESIESKIKEQFVVGRMAPLPVLLAAKGKALLPITSLNSVDNASLDKFLRVKTGSLLTALFNHPLVNERLKKQGQQFHYFFLLRFRDKNKVLCFAVVPFESAANDTPFVPLLKKAYEQGSLRLVSVHCAEVDAVSGAHVPTSLPDSAGEVFETLNRGLHPRLKKIMASANRMAVLNDISDSISELNTVLSRDADASQKTEPVNIRPYLLDAKLVRNTMLRGEVEISEARQEDRFRLELPLKVIGRKRENKDKHFEGYSTNVSTRGLHIIVDGDHPFTESDDLFVDINIKLGDYNEFVKGQRYRVIKARGPELWLAVTGDLASHQARILLREVIQNNLDSLTAIGSNDPVYGLSRAVRNVYSSYHPNLYGIVRRDKHGVLVRSLMRSQNHLPLQFHPLIAEPIGLKMLCKSEVFRQALELNLQKLVDEGSMATFHVCIVGRKKRQSTDVSLVVKSLSAKKENNSFVFHSLKSFGEPKVIKVRLYARGPVFDKYFRDEMRYLLRYAKLKHQDCVAMLSSVNCVLEFQDVTPLFKQSLETN